MRSAALTFTGHGNVYQGVNEGEHWLAWGSYSIRTWFETNLPGPSTDPAELYAGITEYAYGLLRVLKGELYLPCNTPCVLEFADKRRCHVFFTLIGDPSLDNYTVHFVDLAELK